MYEIEQSSLTAAQIRAQVNLIQEVMAAVMKPDVHYGKVPGCDKPTLLKPGSEKILSTFCISVEPLVEDLSTSDEARYRVLAKGIHRNSGSVVGIGVGECSSNEEKYKWRRAVCDLEWDESPTDRRREKWKSGYKDKYNKWHDPEKVKQVRTEIADVANTILKMAKKRAQIDLTLTATAASDIFTQDIEDLPEDMRQDAAEGEGKSITNVETPKTTKVIPDDVPPCEGCGLPIAQTSEESARVIAWCDKKFEGKKLCRACQQKAQKGA